MSFLKFWAFFSTSESGEVAVTTSAALASRLRLLTPRSNLTANWLRKASYAFCTQYDTVKVQQQLWKTSRRHPTDPTSTHKIRRKHLFSKFRSIWQFSRFSNFKITREWLITQLPLIPRSLPRWPISKLLKNRLKVLKNRLRTSLIWANHLISNDGYIFAAIVSLFPFYGLVSSYREIIHLLNWVGKAN